MSQDAKPGGVDHLNHYATCAPNSILTMRGAEPSEQGCREVFCNGGDIDVILLNGKNYKIINMVEYLNIIQIM